MSESRIQFWPRITPDMSSDCCRLVDPKNLGSGGPSPVNNIKYFLHIMPITMST